jgi:hypothetical protein
MDSKMNERINGLRWEARIGYNNQSCDPEVLGKFAELIVKECIDIAYEYDAPKMSGPGMIIGNRIKEHFGVEE